MALSARMRKSFQDQARHVLTTGSRFKAFDQIRQRHFWSTYLFAPDANGYIPQGKFPVFQTPPGQVGQGFTVQLTERETNWKSANRVPDNQNFSISEIGVTLEKTSFLTNPDDDLEDDTVYPGVTEAAFLQNTMCAITYLTNTVELGFAEDFAQASGPTVGTYNPVVVGQSGRFPARFVTNGMAAPGLRRRFKIPILLGHGETFSFDYLVARSWFVGAFALSARFDFWATESFVEKS
jgi:hypothetical protein